MKLPTPEERQAIRDENARKDREFKEAEQRKADETLAAALRLREERIVQILGTVEDCVTRSLEYGRDHAYVRIADGREWTAESNLIGNEVCRRIKLEAPEYVFTLATEEHHYEDENYDSGRRWWVSNYWQAIKVTWPQPEPETIPAECVTLDLVDEQPLVAVAVEPKGVDWSAMVEQQLPEEGEHNPPFQELFTPEAIEAMKYPVLPEIITYKVELANFDSGLPDEFVTKTHGKPPTKGDILQALDRLRKVFLDHYVPGPTPEPGCCGPEVCIMDGDKIAAFIKITAEDDE